MKLSEAIRQAALPQAFGRSVDYVGGPVRARATCALVGAAEVVRGRPYESLDQALAALAPDYPALVHGRVPESTVSDHGDAGEPCGVAEAVVFLNDSLGWSRAQIADWYAQNVENTVGVPGVVLLRV